VEGRPRPITRVPCACFQRLQTENRWGGAPRWTPPAARRRPLAVGCSIRSTCSLLVRLLPLTISLLLRTTTKSDSTSAVSLTEGLPGLNPLEDGREDHLRGRFTSWPFCDAGKTPETLRKKRTGPVSVCFKYTINKSNYRPALPSRTVDIPLRMNPSFLASARALTYPTDFSRVKRVVAMDPASMLRHGQFATTVGDAVYA